MGRGSSVIPAHAKDVLHMVAQYYRLPTQDIVGRSRDPMITEARHVAMYLCRSHLGMTLAAIGRFFLRDHSSIQYACDRIAGEMRQHDSMISRRVEAIRNTAEPGSAMGPIVAVEVWIAVCANGSFYAYGASEGDPRGVLLKSTPTTGTVCVSRVVVNVPSVPRVIDGGAHVQCPT